MNAYCELTGHLLKSSHTPQFGDTCYLIECGRCWIPLFYMWRGWR